MDSHLTPVHKDTERVVFEGPGARRTVGLQLLLHTSLVRLLQPRPQEDAVVMVTHGAEEGGGGGVGEIVGETYLGDQLPEEDIQTPWREEEGEEGGGGQVEYGVEHTAS